jgi:hypothetical protein
MDMNVAFRKLRRAGRLAAAALLAATLSIPPVAAQEAGSLTPGRIDWRELGAGFAVAELSVLAGEREIDRMFLARIDPAKFRFVLRNAPAGRTLGEWMNGLGAAMVINGSFFAKGGLPDTPIVSDGAPLGPTVYDARHGAFVAAGQSAAIRDLRKHDWRQIMAKADAAFVSYPLLLGEDGGHTAQPSDRRANRSFAGEDAAGRIVFGTTQAPSFTLPALAAFLKASPLDLKLALNLDGGPFACQAIAFKGFTRSFCGTFEFTEKEGAGPAVPAEAAGRSRMLPIILGVMPR